MWILSVNDVSMSDTSCHTDRCQIIKTDKWMEVLKSVLKRGWKRAAGHILVNRDIFGLDENVDLMLSPMTFRLGLLVDLSHQIIGWGDSLLLVRKISENTHN